MREGNKLYNLPREGSVDARAGEGSKGTHSRVRTTLVVLEKQIQVQ